MGLSLYGARHQATHEVTARDDVDDEGGKGGEDRAREVDVVFFDTRVRSSRGC